MKALGAATNRCVKPGPSALAVRIAPVAVSASSNAWRPQVTDCAPEPQFGFKNQNLSDIRKSGFAISAHIGRYIMRQADRDCEFRLIGPKHRGFEDEGRPGRIGDHVIGGPEPPARASLFELHLATRLDVDDGARGEGERNVGVKRKPQPRLVFSGSEEKGPQCGIKFGVPVRVAADVAFVEGWNQIEDRVTPLLKPIERVLEGFYPENPRATLRRAEKIFPSADGAEAHAVELEASLRHPLEDGIVIGERTLVGRNAAQTDIGKQQVQLITKPIERVGRLAEGERARKQPKFVLVNAEMLAPCLAHRTGSAVVRQGTIQPLEPHRAGARADHLAQWVVAIEPPIGHQLEPHAATLRCMGKLRIARPLQQRAGICVDKLRIDQM